MSIRTCDTHLEVIRELGHAAVGDGARVDAGVFEPRSGQAELRSGLRSGLCSGLCRGLWVRTKSS